MRFKSKGLNRIFKKVIAGLPYPIKAPVVRRLFWFSEEIASDIEVKIAETADELEGALEVVRREYQREGFLVAGQPMELAPYILKRSATTLIVKVSGKIVGTLTLIKADSIGLPAERVFSIFPSGGELSWDRRHRVAEISRLAVSHSFRRTSGRDVLFPLLKFMYHYASEIFRVDTLVVTCRPRDADFYKAILMFEDFSNRVHVVDDYLGAPATLLELDLKNAPYKFEQVYRSRKRQNLYWYFTQYKSSQLQLPVRPYFKTADSAWNRNLLERLLRQKDRFCLSPMNGIERAFLACQFGQLNLTDSNHALVPQDSRGSAQGRARFDSVLSATLKTKEGQFRNCELVDVSREGGCLYFDDQELGGHASGDRCQVQLQVSDSQVTELLVELIWLSGRRVGFRVLESDLIWSQYIDFHEDGSRAA